MENLLPYTVGELLEVQAKNYPEHEAVVYADRNLRMNYKEFNMLCRTAARGLMKLGVKKGEHIAAWSSKIGRAHV